MSASLEANVDPQSNVDVILDCLNATPESHAWEKEAEWLEVSGYPERVAWRFAEQARSPRWFTNLLDDPRLRASLEGEQSE